MTGWPHNSLAVTAAGAVLGGVKGGNAMKKIAVRKAGTIKLTTTAVSTYCHGLG